MMEERWWGRPSSTTRGGLVAATPLIGTPIVRTKPTALPQVAVVPPPIGGPFSEDEKALRPLSSIDEPPPPPIIIRRRDAEGQEVEHSNEGVVAAGGLAV